MVVSVVYVVHQVLGMEMVQCLEQAGLEELLGKVEYLVSVEGMVLIVEKAEQMVEKKEDFVEMVEHQVCVGMVAVKD